MVLDPHVKLGFLLYFLRMALHNIPMNVKEFSFSFPRPYGSIPLETFNHLSKVKFNVEGEGSDIEHIHQFFSKCISSNISTNNEICRLFTLTLEGRI